MPKMKFKAPKKRDKNSPELVSYDDGYPRTWIRANKEQLDAVEVGKDVTLILKGKLVAKEMRESEDGEPRHEITLEVHESEVDGGGYADLADAD